VYDTRSGAICVMVRSAVVSDERTRLPLVTLTTPTRPAIGAAMMV